MNDVATMLQIGVLVLISAACVGAIVVVWRDDHKWRDRWRTPPGL